MSGFQRLFSVLTFRGLKAFTVCHLWGVPTVAIHACFRSYNNAIMCATAGCGRTSVPALRASTTASYCRRYVFIIE